MKIVPYRAEAFSPLSRGARGLCAYDDEPAAYMVLETRRVPPHPLCAAHAARYEKRRTDRVFPCPFCDTPATPGEVCPKCGVAMPFDANRAREHAVAQHLDGVRRGGVEGNWDGVRDNAARVREGG